MRSCTCKTGPLRLQCRHGGETGYCRAPVFQRLNLMLFAIIYLYIYIYICYPVLDASCVCFLGSGSLRIHPEIGSYIPNFGRPACSKVNQLKSHCLITEISRSYSNSLLGLFLGWDSGIFVASFPLVLSSLLRSHVQPCFQVGWKPPRTRAPTFWKSILFS